MRDKRFESFIKNTENEFVKMNLPSEKDFDIFNLSKDDEQKIEDLIEKFEKIYNKIWNDVGNKLTVDKIWNNHYQESKYKYVFELFK